MRRIVELLILVLCLAVLPAAAQSILPDSLAGWSARLDFRLLSPHKQTQRKMQQL